jgi:tRNA 2-selenouridine synthase SelU
MINKQNVAAHALFCRKRERISRENTKKSRKRHFVKAFAVEGAGWFSWRLVDNLKASLYFLYPRES